MSTSSRAVPSSIVDFGAAGAVLATCIGLIFVTSPFLSYILIAVGAGAGLYLCSSILNQDENGATLTLTDRQTTCFDISIFLLIASIIALHFATPGRVSNALYPLTAVVAAVIAIRILLGDRLLITGLQILLVTVAFRATIWYTYPVYGQDTRVHLALTENIAAAGKITGVVETYYQQYPGAHMFGAVVQHLADVPPNVGFFQSVGLTHVLSLVAVYLLVVKLCNCQRSALLATLTIALSGGHLHLGTELYAQTFANAMLPVLLYLLYTSSDLRSYVLLLLISTLVVVTHNLLPIVLVGFGATLLTISRITDLFADDGTSIRRLPFIRASSALSVITLGTLYYWQVTDYLSYQTNRIAKILNINRLIGSQKVDSESVSAGERGGSGGSGEQSTAGETATPSTDGTATPSGTATPDSEKTPGSGMTPDGETTPVGTPAGNSSGGNTPLDGTGILGELTDLTELGGIPTVSAFGLEFPGLLMWAAPFLFLGVVAIITGLLLSRNIIDSRQLPNDWVLVGLCLFGGFSAAFASGGIGAVNRAAAAITVITAPVVGYLYLQLSRSRLSGRLIIVFLVTVCVLAGTLSAPVAMSERTETSFEPKITTDELRAVSFAQQQTAVTYTDSYVVGYTTTQRPRQTGSGRLATLITHKDIEVSRQNYMEYRTNSTRPLLYRASFRGYYGIPRPITMNKVYTTGETDIHR